MKDSEVGGPLRVLVIPDKYLPDQCAGGAIYADLCEGLVRRGLDVTVRCPYPFYPEWIDKSGRNGWRIERSVEAGVKVERFGFFIPRNSRSAGQRMLLDATFFLSLVRSLFRGRFDVVIAFCPHTGGLAHAVLQRLLFGTPIWLSVMDLPADAAAASGIVRFRGLSALLRTVQKVLFNHADTWRSISPVMIKRLEAIRGREQPTVLVPDWLHPSLGAEIDGLPSKLGRGPGTPVRLFYSGNVGAKQGLLDFCRSLQTSSVPFTFLIRGGGGGSADVRDWVASRGDPRFSFAPLGSEADFARGLHESDFFVITEKPDSGASFFPSKLIPGIASGTPILSVSGAASPLGQEVRDHGLGPAFTWTECQEVPHLLHSVQSQTIQFTNWQRNAARRSEYYRPDSCIDAIEQSLWELSRAAQRSRTRKDPRRSVGVSHGTGETELASDSLV